MRARRSRARRPFLPARAVEQARAFPDPEVEETFRGYLRVAAARGQPPLDPRDEALLRNAIATRATAEMAARPGLRPADAVLRAVNALPNALDLRKALERERPSKWAKVRRFLLVVLEVAASVAFLGGGLLPRIVAGIAVAGRTLLERLRPKGDDAAPDGPPPPLAG